MEDDYLRERKADRRAGGRAAAARAGRGAGRPAPAARRRRGRATSAAKTRWCWWPTTSRRPTCCSSSAASSPASSPMSAARTSHTAIVARSMDIPAVVGAREASRLIRQDDWVVIDGDAGVVIVDPSPIVLEEYRFRQRQSELERARLDRLRHTPAVTLDGQRGGVAGQHRAARRCRRRAGGRRRRRGPVPQRVPVHEPRRRPARRGRAVRGLPRRGGGHAGPAGDDTHGRHRRRQAAGAHVARRSCGTSMR